MIIKENCAEFIATETDLLKYNSTCINDIEHFFRWLKNHKIYNDYINEYKHYAIIRPSRIKNSNIKENLQDRLFRMAYGICIIDSTLVWASTKQGSEFWWFYNEIYEIHANAKMQSSEKLNRIKKLLKRYDIE